MPALPQRWLVLLILATGLALAGTATASEEGVAVVRIKDYKFDPPTLVIRSGTKVRWVNEEKRTSHSVHFVVEGLPDSERMMGGDTWERTFTKPGTYRYVCGPHPEMRGTIEVRP
jgi:plastocyanin